jgi:hypothetical protein
MVAPDTLANTASITQLFALDGITSVAGVAVPVLEVVVTIGPVVSTPLKENEQA